MAQPDLSQHEKDEALLQKFGYKQELQRTLGFLSNFAVAFSYISVSTGTFALFYLGLAAGGPAFFWPGTGLPRDGLRPWKARCAAAISPPKPSPAPPDRILPPSSFPTSPPAASCACSHEVVGCALNSRL